MRPRRRGIVAAQSVGGAGAGELRPRPCGAGATGRARDAAGAGRPRHGGPPTDRGGAPRSVGPHQLLVTVWLEPLLVQVTVPPVATAAGVGLKALSTIVTPTDIGGDPPPPTTTCPVIPPWIVQR